MASKPYTTDLETFVRAANLLPDGAPPTTALDGSASHRTLLMDVYRAALNAFPGPAHPAAREPWTSGLRKTRRTPLLRALGREFRLGSESLSDDTRLREIYDSLFTLRAVLSAITLRTPGDSSTSITVAVRVEETRRISTDESNRIAVRATVVGTFFDALHQAEIDRIRRCEVCGTFFLAWRRDKGACSPQCCNTRNVREKRRREKEGRYAATRRKTQNMRRERQVRGRHHTMPTDH